MITIRKATERGHANHGWLDTYHTFSFATYFDPQHTKFRALRVLNEDWIQPGEGFDTHPHENMEILTYVIEGELAHKDSMGNGSTIHSGEFQRMSAGTGIMHSEINPSDHPAHILQMWIFPDRHGIPPEYEQRAFAKSQPLNDLCLVASADGRDESLRVHQDFELFRGRLEAEHKVNYKIPFERHVWIQIINGSLDVNGTIMHAGDGAAIEGELLIQFAARQTSEFLLFDLA